MGLRLLSLALTCGVAAAATDISAQLLKALSSEDEGGILRFDLKSLHRAVPEYPRRDAAERAAAVLRPGDQDAGAVIVDGLLDFAFGGAGDGWSNKEHTPEQQKAQEWLFARCKRLPAAGSMRQQCVRALAGFAAKLQAGGPGNARASSLVAQRQEAAQVLGLRQRRTFMLSGEDMDREDEAVQDAAETAQHDVEMQKLMGNAEVRAAFAAIAEDPSAIERYRGSAAVMDAVGRLQGLLERQGARE